MKIAIIPARGGSKRIPRKNIKDFNGKPIIAYSIEAALASGCFDKVIVSTDDDEIAAVAVSYGAAVPFIRPSELSDDYATTAAVIEHALKYFESEGYSVKYLCCIYPTAPLISSNDISRSFRELEESNAHFCFPVCSFAYPIQRALKLNQENRVQMFQPEHLNTRSQDLEEGYHDTGLFYWGRAESFLDGIPVFSEQSIPYLIPRYRVIDIDNPEDWDIALKLFSAFKEVN
ncbi:pseudaminic acid cytidylyltransferase [Vibrio sp. 10N.247.311.51]|uniref:pseudaminic acid cytidylyltransferase n=1 Tax=Vibrio sp. 10N.247.311.51 TaxID=3229996 RepID=UPI00354F8EF4